MNMEIKDAHCGRADESITSIHGIIDCNMVLDSNDWE